MAGEVGLGRHPALLSPAQPLVLLKQAGQNEAADTQISTVYCFCGRLDQLHVDTPPRVFSTSLQPFARASARAEVYFSSEITLRLTALQAQWNGLRPLLPPREGHGRK